MGLPNVKSGSARPLPHRRARIARLYERLETETDEKTRSVILAQLRALGAPPPPSP